MTTNKLLVERVQDAIIRMLLASGQHNMDMAVAERVAKAAIEAMQSYKHSENIIGTWHTPNNKDGGCQMRYKVVEGFCAVCGSTNRSCQPDKHLRRDCSYGRCPAGLFSA